MVVSIMVPTIKVFMAMSLAGRATRDIRDMMAEKSMGITIQIRATSMPPSIILSIVIIAIVLYRRTNQPLPLRISTLIRRKRLRNRLIRRSS